LLWTHAALVLLELLGGESRGLCALHESLGLEDGTDLVRDLLERVLAVLGKVVAAATVLAAASLDRVIVHYGKEVLS